MCICGRQLIAYMTPISLSHPKHFEFNAFIAYMSEKYIFDCVDISRSYQPLRAEHWTDLPKSRTKIEKRREEPTRSREEKLFRSSSNEINNKYSKFWWLTASIKKKDGEINTKRSSSSSASSNYFDSILPFRNFVFVLFLFVLLSLLFLVAILVHCTWVVVQESFRKWM